MPKNSKQFDFFFVLKGQSNKNHFKLVDEIPIQFDLHTRQSGLASQENTDRPN